MSNVPKGYKQTEVGVIPVEWKAGPISEISEVIMGQSPSGDSYNSKGQGIAMLNGPTEFTMNHPIPVQYTTKPTKFSKPGDILFCVRGSSTGRMNISDRDYCIGRGLAAIRGTENSETQFVYYHLQNLAAEVLEEARGAGSTFPNIAGKELASKLIPLPPLPEQKKIAEILTSVDDTIESTRKVIDQTKKVKQGLLQELLTKGIGHKKFKDTEIGRIPVEWEVVRLGIMLGRIDAGWSPNCSDDPPLDGQWGVLKVSAISSGNYLPDESKRLPIEMSPRPNLEVKCGDVLCIRANGNTALVATTVLVRETPSNLMLSDKTLRLVPDLDKLEAGFLACNMQLQRTRDQVEMLLSGSSGQKNISQSQLKNIVLPKVPLSEQKQIAAILSSVDDKISAQEKELAQLQKIKKGLMQDLLTGKVRVKV